MDSNTKHTPGPWVFGNRRWVYGPNDECVAVVGDGFRETDSANAKLIAAAPELLEALSDLVYEMTAEASAEQRLRNCGYALEKARLALQRAGGK
jgi:hypothetical protein